jgi:uncharacterized protein YcgL (UPF0745 family)
MQRICSIYRSAKVEGMYLYVDKAEGLKRVPEPLLQRFGKAELAMTLLIHAERKLARADAVQILQAIAQSGFFLQLPPQSEHDSVTTQIINEAF